MTSFEQILRRLRDLVRQDTARALAALPGYYWGTVVSVAPLQVFLDVQDPAEDPRPASDTVGGLRPEERVLLVLLDGSFSVVGAAGRENVSGVARFATIGARDAAYPEPEDGLICHVADIGYYVRQNGRWQAVFDDTDWQPLTLLNGWSGSQSPAVKRKNGLVQFRGEVYGGSTGSSTPAFVLDVPFRPVSRFRTVIGYLSGNQTIFAVDAAGGCWLSDPRSSTPGWGLAGVQFPASDSEG